MAKFVDVDEKVKEVEKEVVSKPSFDTADPNYYLIEGLPSKGKFYPEDTKIYGRPLKVLEVKQLSSINESNADNIINSILKRTIRGIDVNEILVADKLFIIFWLRTNTYRDSGYAMKFDCSFCSKEASYEFTLDKLGIKEISDAFNIDKLKFKLKGCGVDLEFGFPRVKDEKIAEEFKNNYSTVIKDLDEDIVGICVLLKSIAGEYKNMLERYNFIVSMNPSDYAYLISYITKWSFGVKPFVSVTCEHCGGVANLGVSFQGEFWIPEVNID